MLSDVWFYLFWVAVALCASTGAALFVVLHPATDPADTGNQQREYTSPDYTRTAGFAISEHPDTEILIPQRFWLINDNTAEIEYLIVPSGFARLRAAPAGTLDIPDSFLNGSFESVEEYPIDGITVTQSQSPGRDGMLRWTKDGFDFALLVNTPEMNLLGGVAPDFVRQSTALVR